MNLWYWWSLSVAKVGLPATVLLVLYLGLVFAWLTAIAINLGRHLRYQLGAKRRLRQLHQRPGGDRVVGLADRLARRRAEIGANDAA